MSINVWLIQLRRLPCYRGEVMLILFNETQFKFPRDVMPPKAQAEVDVVKEMLGRILQLPVEKKRLEDKTIRILALDVAVKFQP